jgi:soluble lytic murein transglycosylase-like protein
VKRVISLLMGAATPLLAPPPPFNWTALPVIQMPVEELIREAAVTEGVRPGFALGIAWRESRFQPGVTSSEGAMGVFQLIPLAVKALGVDDPFDPAQNVRAGVRYLGQLLRQYRSEALADCIFAHGPTACLP